VCRNSDEWDLHSKRTGHAACDDKVGGWRRVAAGTAEQRVLLASCCCVYPTHICPLCTHPAVLQLDQTDEVEAIDSEAQMKAARAEEAGAAAGAPGSSGAAPEELVPAEVSPELLKQMEEMGFAAARATRALYHTGGESLEAALQWLDDHQADADLDEPLMVPKVGTCCVAGQDRAGQDRTGVA
jgi:hypothetical protein